MPWHPMKEHMEKLDAWGAAQKKKLDEQRTAGPGVSARDRLNLARGKDSRWEATKSSTSNAEDVDGTNITPRASARPPPPPITARKPVVPATAAAAAPPPPPARGAASSATATPPPRLPPRMANEQGVDNPPPAYNAPVPAPSAPRPPARATPTTAGTSTTAADFPAAGGRRQHIEFSKFTQEDKEAFFTLLDEYFESRVKVSRQASASHKGFLQRAAAQPVVSVSIEKRTPPARPSVPKPASVAQASSPFPALSASAHAASELSLASTASSFFFYRTLTSWSQVSPWYTHEPTPQPEVLANRNDCLWLSTTSYLGNSATYRGAALFSDLSVLVFQLRWDRSRPQASLRVQVGLRDAPPALDEAELVTSHLRYGEHIAAFAERAAAERRSVGDGECWTLAKEAIDEANRVGGFDEQGKAVVSIGRTHGHLLFAGRGAPRAEAQRGRWRGGDRVRDRWGGVRRGDIVEWRTARCSELGAPAGSFMKIGEPDHTAVVVADSPVPERLALDSNGGEQPELAPHELVSLETVEQSAGVPAMRRTYDLRTFTEGDMWIYRPVGVGDYLGGCLTADWPPSLPGVTTYDA